MFSAIKIITTIALSFLAQDTSGPGKSLFLGRTAVLILSIVTISGRLDNIRNDTGPDAFTLMNVPRGQTILIAAKLETDGKNCVKYLLELFKNIDHEKNHEPDEMLSAVILYSIVGVALHRPGVREQILEAILKRAEGLKTTKDK